jgi:hypothetical protein
VRIDRTRVAELARSIWLMPGVIAATLFLAGLGVAFVIVLGSFWHHVSGVRAAYAERLQAVNISSAPPVQSDFRADQNSLKRMSERCEEITDSLGLGPQIRGFVVDADLRPPDFLSRERAHVKVDVLLDCGCVETGRYDILSLEIEPSSRRASITNLSQRMVLAAYKPLGNGEGR